MGRSKEIESIAEIPQKIETFLIAIALLIIIGTLGFRFSSSNSFQESFLTTIDALIFEFHANEGFAKFLQITIALFGGIILWWAVWSLIDLLTNKTFSEYLNTRKLIRRIRKMREHYIIAGGGRVGEEIAEKLCKNKSSCVIIEKDEQKYEKLKAKGFHVILGDVEDEEVLKKAGIKNAKTLIVAMPETEKNLIVTISAKELNPQIEIHARADKPAFVSKLKKAGAKTVIVPELAAAEDILKNLK